MNFVTMLMMATLSNLDNIAIGLSYGMRNIRISSAANLLIAVITSTGTYLAMSCGQTISTFFPLPLARASGSALLCAAGLWVLWQGLTDANRVHQVSPNREIILCRGPFRPATIFTRLAAVIIDPGGADLDLSGDISMFEATLLGLALTMNNLAAGLGAGLVGMNAAITTLLVFCLSILTLSGGLYCGIHYTTRRCGSKTYLLSGVLLIIIGFYEYVAP
ncbi:MAG: sporulation membrane protein YtaF [Negativicutes bacterium]|nr:sporulation membrane protein YtaF [Negativicutes bacterium]